MERTRSIERTARQTIQIAKKALVPDFVQREMTDGTNIVGDIVSIAKELQMEVDEGDVEDLLDEHRDELTVEELQAIVEEEYEEASSDEE